MFDHPFAIAFLLNLFLTLCFWIISRNSSFLVVLSRFVYFPYWAVCIVFGLAYFIRTIRDSYFYRLARTYHIRTAPDTIPLPVPQSPYLSDNARRAFGLD